MAEIMIREFMETDLSSVQKVIYETIDTCYPDHYPPLAVEYFKDYHRLQNILERSEKGKVLIVGTRKKIIGTGSIVGNEISGVFILPEYQKHGHGKDMMDELEEIGRINGNTEAELSVSLPSLDFYKKQGYTVVDKCSIRVGKDQELEYWKAIKKLKRIETR
jgi:ribosomal protein S18 acetylase RimI-like enzyme